MSGGIELQEHGHRGFGRIGGGDFNHNPAADIEEEYDKLRSAAQAEYKKKREYIQRSREAYEQGDGAGAKELSNEGKRHGAEGERLDKQASEWIFRMNNAGAQSDTIDLHGQFVDEAVAILTARIQKDQERGQTHLHAIVGKGNHSANHVQKLKPAVEDLCRDLGLHYQTEENAGRIYIDLQGEEVTEMPPLPPQSATSHAGYGEQPYQQPYEGYPGQQQQHHGGHHQQQEQQGDDLETLFIKLLKKACCAVM